MPTLTPSQQGRIVRLAKALAAKNRELEGNSKSRTTAAPKPIAATGNPQPKQRTKRKKNRSAAIPEQVVDNARQQEREMAVAFARPSLSHSAPAPNTGDRATKVYKSFRCTRCGREIPEKDRQQHLLAHLRSEDESARASARSLSDGSGFHTREGYYDPLTGGVRVFQGGRCNGK